MQPQEQASCRVGITGVIDGHAHLHAEPDYAARHVDAALACGIERTVVSGLGKVWGGLDNDGVEKAAEAWPEHLIPLFFVILGQDGEEAAAAAKKRGFRGLKITQPLLPYDDERAFPIYAKAEELGLPILFHSGVMAHVPGVYTSTEFMRPMRLDGVARRFPGLKIQIAHLGVPEYEVATTLARIVPNIYVDATGSPNGGWYTSKSAEFLPGLLYWETWSRKLMFGTDVHYRDLPAAIGHHRRLLSAMSLTAEEEARVYRDNAREFFGEIEGTYETVGYRVENDDA
jgi:predicted TIM-barrel fold metal-dependent hydrolase